MEQKIIVAGQKVGYDELRPPQIEVIKGYCGNKDVFFCAPTGAGKSATFEVACHLLPESKILIISPLVSLMTMQANLMREKGLKATYISGIEDPTAGSCSATIHAKNALGSDSNIWIASPETCLGSLRDVIAQVSSDIGAIFIDEAHCILKYGLPDKQRKIKAFRPMYSRLSDLRSIIGPKPIVCLTATATDEEQKKIIKLLGLVDPIIVSSPPTKNNITYYVKSVGNDIDENFTWLSDHILRNEFTTKRMLIFFRRVKYLGDVFEFLKCLLPTSLHKSFEMYHMKTEEIVKKNIIKSFRDLDGDVRVVLCSSSFSMGLDLRDVKYIIHYGPPNDIGSYLQETGRSARDPNIAGHAVLLKYPHSTGSGSISPDMKNYLTTKECRRKVLLSPYTTNFSRSPGHLCCDLCRDYCNCSACTDLDPVVSNILSCHQGDSFNLFTSDNESEGESDCSMDEYLARKYMFNQSYSSDEN